MALPFSDSVMRVSQSIFKNEITRNLFLVNFQIDRWPGFNLRTLLPKAMLPKPLQSSRTRLLSVSNSNLSCVLRLFCHRRCQPFFGAIIDFICGESARQKRLGGTKGTAAAVASVKAEIIMSTSAPESALSSEKFKSIQESISRRNS
jgi:hypothetical protein